MIPVRLAEITRARVVRGDASVEVRAVVADSREAAPGALFVALEGQHLDGRDFVADAASRGAVAALLAPGRPVPATPLALVEADDPLAALADLAATVRRRSSARVVGVAGSAGKTTTKDILHALCAPHVPTVASRRSFNNELGVPLTLCGIEPETEIAVCELGTGAPGELRALTRVAQPDVGVVTAIGPEHLEAFGSVAGVVRAEAELIEALPPRAALVRPAAEPRLTPFRRSDLTELTFGGRAGADVWPSRWVVHESATSVELDVCGERVGFSTNLRTRHHRHDLCAAAAAYAALRLPLDRVGEGAATIAVSPMRGQERARRGGGVVVNDAYNANPLSLRAALTALGERRAAGRRVAVLGEMAELGRSARAWHRRAGRDAAARGIDLLVAIGPLARDYCVGAGGRIPTRWFPDVSSAAEALPAILGPGDVVLLKGSRVAAVERLEEAAL